MLYSNIHKIIIKKMKITWNNIHYFIIAIILFNFGILYILRNKSNALEQVTSEKEPLTILIDTNDTSNQTVNSQNTSIAEDIGKAVSDSGKPLPLVDTGNINQFIEIIGPGREIVSPRPLAPHQKPQSLMLVFVLLGVLITIALLVSFLEMKSLQKRDKGIFSGGIVESGIHNANYVLMDD